MGQTYTYDDKKMIEFHVDLLRDEKYSFLHHHVDAVEEKNNGLRAHQSWFCSDKSRKVLISFGQD